jgi:hypothetical protein
VCLPSDYSAYRNYSKSNTHTYHISLLFLRSIRLKASTAEVKKLEKEGPHSVIIKLYHTIDGEPIILKNTFTEVVGSTYYKITVEVRVT